jgi:uncharacterized membrane protein
MLPGNRLYVMQGSSTSERKRLERRGWLCRRAALLLLQTPSSRIAFGLLLLAIGIWGLVQRGFVGIWAPGIRPAELRPAVAMLCSLVSALGGAGLLLQRSEKLSARALLAWLLLWLLWCKGVVLIHVPGDAAWWESLGETAVVLAAAWTLASSSDGPPVVYGLSLIAFGASHFAYSKLTASLVPAWLPWHLEWVYLTGAFYVAAGLALVIGRLAKAAAALSALQMGLFGVLVWLAKIAAGTHDPDTLNEAAISFALAVSGWVIASALSQRLLHES